MREWFRKFFAVDNSVNEDTVLGCIFAGAALVCIFVPLYSGAPMYASLSAMAAFFGKNIFKNKG